MQFFSKIVNASTCTYIYIYVFLFTENSESFDKNYVIAVGVGSGVGGFLLGAGSAAVVAVLIARRFVNMISRGQYKVVDVEK